MARAGPRGGTVTEPRGSGHRATFGFCCNASTASDPRTGLLQCIDDAGRPCHMDTASADVTQNTGAGDPPSLPCALE